MSSGRAVFHISTNLKKILPTTNVVYNAQYLAADYRKSQIGAGYLKALRAKSFSCS